METPSSSTSASSSATSQDLAPKKLKSYLKLMVKLAKQNSKIIDCVTKLITKNEESRDAILRVIKPTKEVVDRPESHPKIVKPRTFNRKITERPSRVARIGSRLPVAPTNPTFELVERGNCDLTIKRNSFAEKTKCLKIVNYIVRRFRNFESQTGGSAYRIDMDTRMFLKQEKLSRMFPCYGRDKYECNVSLLFEFERSSSEYKLSICGEHNHSFDNVFTNLKWDRILDSEEPPVIEIISTKIHQPVENDVEIIADDSNHVNLDLPRSSVRVKLERLQTND